MAEQENNNVEMTDEEKQAKISEMENLLVQMDYTGRKVAFEVAAKLKELNPNLSMPVYEKYKASEQKANEYRQIINDMQA
ncbi:MAG: hypothetical protein J5606_00130 [Bacteroidales bacterium]|jgi:hypothetical protein|nr:hypothetical protein [Bacteroidales bacterium]